MGFTVTTNLELIKPDTNESIKEDLPTFNGWAFQNGENCDTIDSLFRHTNATYTLNWQGDTTDPVLGAGGIAEGKFLRLWPKLVIGYFRINTGGAGFSAGSGFYTIDFPVAPDPELLTFNDSFNCGKAILGESGAPATSGNFTVMYRISSSAGVLRPSSGGVWDPTNPITLQQNDRISGYFMYPTETA